MSNPSSDRSGNYVLLTRLADEFAARYRAGERPPLQEYLDRYPELAEEIRERLKEAIEDLRSAADRLQGKKSHSGRNTGLLVAGIALGILFNPVTGPETRKWVKDMIGGGGDEFGGDYSPNGGTTGPTT